jgi:hypothetical protein
MNHNESWAPSKYFQGFKDILRIVNELPDMARKFWEASKVHKTI